MRCDEKYLSACASSLSSQCSNTEDVLEPAEAEIKSKATERGSKMIVVTSIYCAKLERIEDAFTHKRVEPNIIDLKEACRDLLSVYQGTNRSQPMDGER
jgi:hypothetical protein